MAHQRCHTRSVKRNLMPNAFRGRRSEVLQWGSSFFARWILVPQNLYKELKQMIYQRKRDLMTSVTSRRSSEATSLVPKGAPMTSF